MPDTRNGSKATIREVRDLVDDLKDEQIAPMTTTLTRIETKLDIHLDNYDKNCKANKDDHKSYISKRPFFFLASVLGALLTYIAIIQTLGG